MRTLKTLCAGMLLFTSAQSFSQTNTGWDYIAPENIVSKDSVTRSGYTLIFINKDTAFNPALKERMVNTFFKVYPAESEIYNRRTLKKVIFVIDPAYDGVAATSGSIVRYNPGWFARNPGDIDVVTHEVMHIVQSYPGGAGPGWITEGIADYVRHTLGVDNAGAHWSLPEYQEKHRYTDAYRITARFFVWIEKNKCKGLVKKMDTAMRSKTYNDAMWKDLTGLTVDELWAAYSSNPAI